MVETEVGAFLFLRDKAESEVLGLDGVHLVFLNAYKIKCCFFVNKCPNLKYI